MSLHDGHVLCHYVGFIATGIRQDKPEPETPGATNRYRSVMTRYGPLPEADGIRFLWLYTEDQGPTSRCQTLSVVLRGELAKDPLTLTQLIDAQRRTAERAGQPWGDELPTLVLIRGLAAGMWRCARPRSGRCRTGLGLRLRLGRSYWAAQDNGAAGNVGSGLKKAAYAASSVSLNNDLATLAMRDIAALEARETSS